MPYTVQGARRDEPVLRAIAATLMEKGDLTWAISVLMDEFTLSHGIVSYGTLSAARSAAQDAADEWYRRVMAPYEDKKLRSNGEVYRVLEYV